MRGGHGPNLDISRVAQKNTDSRTSAGGQGLHFTEFIKISLSIAMARLRPFMNTKNISTRLMVTVPTVDRKKSRNWKCRKNFPRFGLCTPNEVSFGFISLNGVYGNVLCTPQKKLHPSNSDHCWENVTIIGTAGMRYLTVQKLQIRTMPSAKQTRDCWNTLPFSLKYSKQAGNQNKQKTKQA